MNQPVQRRRTWFYFGRYKFCWRLEVGPVDLVWWKRGRT